MLLHKGARPFAKLAKRRPATAARTRQRPRLPPRPRTPQHGGKHAPPTPVAARQLRPAVSRVTRPQPPKGRLARRQLASKPPRLPNGARQRRRMRPKQGRRRAQRRAPLTRRKGQLQPRPQIASPAGRLSPHRQ